MDPRILAALGRLEAVLRWVLDGRLAGSHGSPGESVSVECAKRRACRPADVRELYQATVNEAIDEWRARFAAAGAFYEPIQTDQPFGVPLRRAFAARQRLS